MLLARGAHWAGMLTPVVETAWQQARAASPADIFVQGQHLSLHVQREDGRTEPSLDAVAALLRLGLTVLQATHARGSADASLISH